MSYFILSHRSKKTAHSLKNSYVYILWLIAIIAKIFASPAAIFHYLSSSNRKLKKFRGLKKCWKCFSCIKLESNKATRCKGKCCKSRAWMLRTETSVNVLFGPKYSARFWVLKSINSQCCNFLQGSGNNMSSALTFNNEVFPLGLKNVVGLFVQF
jgi:hypothetical protein